MAPGFEAGSHDRVDTGLLKYRSFVRRCRGSNRDDVLIPALVEDFAWRNAVDKAEHRYVGVQKDARLIFEAHRHVGCIDRLGRSERRQMMTKQGEASVDGGSIRWPGR